MKKVFYLFLTVQSTKKASTNPPFHRRTISEKTAIVSLFSNKVKLVAETLVNIPKSCVIAPYCRHMLQNPLGPICNSRTIPPSADFYSLIFMLLDLFKARIESAYADNEYPVGRWQAAQWHQTRPLAGLKILDATPVFQNTISKYISLMEAGADLVIGLSDIMPKDERIVDWLKCQGATIVTPKDTIGPIDLVLDCAGAFADLTPSIGYVELTRSGVYRYTGKSKPVFIADGGRIKRIETCLGTGESYFRAMAQLGYSDWKDKNIVIFGSGKVGTGLIAYAHQYGCRITVVTRLQDVSDTVRKLAGRIIAADDSPAICEAVSHAYAVVTATGVAEALKFSCPADVLLKSPALIANMGVEDEFGADLPASRVLQGKRPINFILKDPTLMKYIDATMALHNAGAVWLTEHPQALGLIEPPKELEETLLDVCRRNGTIASELQYI